MLLKISIFFRPFLAVGKPQRVKRLPIPVEIKEDSSDEDENKDYDFKPLETTQPAGKITKRPRKKYLI